jgi:hypothetical protein
MATPEIVKHIEALEADLLALQEKEEKFDKGFSNKFTRHTNTRHSAPEH